MALIEIVPPAYDVDVAIAYATPQNFTGRPVYARAGCYLHPDAAAALAREGERFEIDIFGDLCGATVRLEPIYDPQGVRLRS